MQTMKPWYILAVLVALSGASFGTKERPHLPCEYSGTVSRKYPNTAFSMSSDVMQQRATKRVDLSGHAKQLDIRGVVAVDVLVGTDGNVVCVHGFCGYPMLLKDVEEAVRQWRFKPLKENNVPVAYVGRLDFALCNIGCGQAEFLGDPAQMRRATSTKSRSRQQPGCLSLRMQGDPGSGSKVW